MRMRAYEAAPGRRRPGTDGHGRLVGAGVADGGERGSSDQHRCRDAEHDRSSWPLPPAKRYDRRDGRLELRDQRGPPRLDVRLGHGRAEVLQPVVDGLRRRIPRPPRSSRTRAGDLRARHCFALMAPVDVSIAAATSALDIPTRYLSSIT